VRGESHAANRAARASPRERRSREVGQARARAIDWLSLHFRRFARRTLPWSKIEVFPVRSIILDIFEAMLAVVRAVRDGT
jgi:hypothetical protein